MVYYRKSILIGDVQAALKELLLKIAEDNGFYIEQLEVMPDHVHLFVTASPNHLVADMIKIKALKGVSARFLTRAKSCKYARPLVAAGLHTTISCHKGTYSTR